MSDALPPPAEPETPPPPPPPVWEPLPPRERRVLGVLIEKQKTAGDTYPMTINAIVTGSNQKSNREPVMSLDDDEVEEALLDLNRKVLVNRVQGGRVEKWRHLLYDLWKVNKVEMAVVAELLLRGPQTEGDLRGRASRMDDIADLDTLRTLLRDLVRRNFVVYLTPGGRGAVVTHGFHTADELAAERAKHGGGGDVSARSAGESPTVARSASDGQRAALETKLAEAVAEIEKLKGRVAALEAKAPH